MAHYHIEVEVQYPHGHLQKKCYKGGNKVDMESNTHK